MTVKVGAMIDVRKMPARISSTIIDVTYIQTVEMRVTMTGDIHQGTDSTNATITIAIIHPVATTSMFYRRNIMKSAITVGLIISVEEYGMDVPGAYML